MPYTCIVSDRTSENNTPKGNGTIRSRGSTHDPTRPGLTYLEEPHRTWQQTLLLSTAPSLSANSTGLCFL